MSKLDRTIGQLEQDILQAQRQIDALAETEQSLIIVRTVAIQRKALRLMQLRMYHLLEIKAAYTPP